MGTQPNSAVSGAATAPEATPLPERSHTATVDEHLLTPAEDGNAGDPASMQHADIYARMVHHFGLPECSDRPEALRWAEWYAEHPKYMARVLKRAEPWLWMILDELERRDMPAELALLPIVESAYDPFAYSSGRALGAWQFLASTGRQYGLVQNAWYDGRRDVWAATDAALDYLQYLEGFFDGDWLLALAAYNAGEGRVGRSVKRNLAAGKPGDYWSIRLPKETRGYVPKLMGLACLFRDATGYGFKPPATANQQVIERIDFGTQTDLVLLSQLAEVPIDQLFTLNPGFNRWASAPTGPHRIVLPVRAAERMQALVPSLEPSQLMRWDQVTVEAGDTLSGLARRHGVDVAVLRSANNLSSDLIRVGQRLKLPRDQQLMVDPLYASAAAELRSLQAGLLASNRTSHTVRSGESLSVIAQRYRVSTRDLQRWNKLSNPNRLRVGQKLTVFMSPAPQGQRSGSSSYVVRSGDSLWSIARKHKVKLQDLLRWNGLDNTAVIQPGQSLKILF